MGVNLSTVNLNGVDPNVALDPIPAGWYDAVIVGTSMKPTKDNATTGGQYMEIVSQVTTGPHTGRKLFDNLNLVNQNPTAVEIAFKTLKSIYNAIGVAGVNDSDDLHGKPLKIKVKLKAASGEYEARNEVQGYDGPNSNHAPAGAGIAVVGGVAGAPAGQPAWATGGAPAGGAPAGGAPAWATGGAPAAPAGGPPAFTPPGAQAAPPAAPADPLQAGIADGWQPHPQYPGYYWKGQETISADDVRARYYVAPAPAAPAGPPAFTPPAGAAVVGAPGGGAPAWQPPGAGVAGAPAQPWQQPAPAGGAPAWQPPGGAPAAATGAGGPTPPWAQGG